MWQCVVHGKAVYAGRRYLVEHRRRPRIEQCRLKSRTIDQTGLMEKIAEAFGETFRRDRLQQRLQMRLAQIPIPIKPLQDLQIALTEHQPLASARSHEPGSASESVTGDGFGCCNNRHG